MTTVTTWRVALTMAGYDFVVIVVMSQLGIACMRGDEELQPCPFFIYSSLQPFSLLGVTVVGHCS